MGENNQIYDKVLEAYDWRYSAAIYGLIKFFRYHDPFGENYKIEEDSFYYNSKFLTEEKYLKFVEYYYNDNLHHKWVENKLTRQKEFSEEEKKFINEKLAANTIMKKVFKKIKFTGDNKEEILNEINLNREVLILETFKRKNDMYKNYCNDNQIFNEAQKYSRLNGYYIDAGKKGKSTGFFFDPDTFVGNDALEFDFIPFAFLGDRKSFFINDNYTLKKLENTNEIFENSINSSIYANENTGNGEREFFKALIKVSEFIEYDVEVIVKNVEKDYFETLYLRKKNIEVLKNIKDYKCFCFSHKINDNYYLNVQSEVINCILNNTLLDLLIEFFIKSNRNYNYLVNQMIYLNTLIKEVIYMDKNSKEYNKEIYKARKCAKEVVKKLEENKLKSYRQKLISAISFKDYDRVCEIILNLSQYTGIYFNFTYSLYEDFEENKEIAYAFINDLDKGVLYTENNKENDK